MKKLAIGFITVFALSLIMSACSTGKGGQKCPAYSKTDDKQTEDSRI